VRASARLIPIFSDVIAPDPEMAALIDAEGPRALRGQLEEVIGQTESLLYRRGNFNGTWTT
jgi:S-sulfosulfanyl-L-cysteine sulfohydrolase